VTQSDRYLLGRSEAEETRLKRQIASFAPDSDAQLERIGIRSGERVIDLGCGPGGVLDLLGKRVGPTGSVLGLERSARFVEQARRFVDDHALPQVKVVEGDAYGTGLPRASFDGGHMRLVLINVPEPERIVQELVSLVRPGGWVASFEADFVSHICDPPLPAWNHLVDAYVAYAAAEGIDLFIGRRIHNLFRAAGVVDIDVDAVVHVYPAGHQRRPILLDFIDNVRDNMVERGIYAPEDLDRDMRALKHHLSNPEVLVTSQLFYRLCARVPPDGRPAGRAGRPVDRRTKGKTLR
jgi:SAM-dependent methyltransferase